MLNMNLQRRYPPGIHHTIRIYFDPVLKSAELLTRDILSISPRMEYFGFGRK